MKSLAILLLLPAAVAAYPPLTEADFIIKDFKLSSGDTLPELRMHYRTLGKPRRDKADVVCNAVLLLHATGGKGDQFVGKGKADDWFANEMFGKGQPLDAERYFIIIPDNLGHGKSTKPSDGLKGRFPRYGYHDMIAAQHRLLTEGLDVHHLRLVVGTSMGGMHTWLWGQKYPDFMDLLVPLASLPDQISGRNRMWRKTVSELVRGDPEWNGGDYKAQPRSLRTAAQILHLMSGNPALRQKEAPTLKKADEVFEKDVAKRLKNLDANDLLYALESSFDYDPAPGLDKIRAPLLAINFADDLINPPELGILEREIKRVPNGRALLIPASDQTQGHSTHTKAALWKGHLRKLLDVE